MQLYEQMGPAHFAIFNRYLERGELSRYQSAEGDDLLPSQKIALFLENSLNLMEETTFTAKLKRLIAEYRDNPKIMNYLMDIVMALNTNRPKDDMTRILKKLHAALKVDKKAFEKAVVRCKQTIEATDKESAEAMLKNF